MLKELSQLAENLARAAARYHLSRLTRWQVPAVAASATEASVCVLIPELEPAAPPPPSAQLALASLLPSIYGQQLGSTIHSTYAAPGGDVRTCGIPGNGRALRFSPWLACCVPPLAAWRIDFWPHRLLHAAQMPARHLHDHIGATARERPSKERHYEPSERRRPQM